MVPRSGIPGIQQRWSLFYSAGMRQPANKAGHYGGKRTDSARCHAGLIPSVPSDFSGTHSSNHVERRGHSKHDLRMVQTKKKLYISPFLPQIFRRTRVFTMVPRGSSNGDGSYACIILLGEQ